MPSSEPEKTKTNDTTNTNNPTEAELSNVLSKSNNQTGATIFQNLLNTQMANEAA